MKFHFFGSLLGDREIYRLIFNLLKQLGCRPVTHHILERKIEDVERETPAESEDYVRKMTYWVRQVDFVIFEVTKEEVSLGYEIMLALDMCKPVLVLYQTEKGRVPFTLKGVDNERLFIYSYDKDKPEELKRLLKTALEDIKKEIDSRFTLLLPPKIITYLNSLAKNEKIPRSVYIRKLIKRDMKRREK